MVKTSTTSSLGSGTMNRILRIIVPILILVAVADAAVILRQEALPDSSDNDVAHVAMNLPLTGALHVYGQPILRGALMAYEELQKSGAKPGLKFHWLDNHGTPLAAVSRVKLPSENKADIFCTLVQPQIMATKDWITGPGTPDFLWIPDMFINKSSDNNLRVIYNCRTEAELMVKYAEKRKPRRVALAYCNLPYVKEEFQTGVIPGLVKLGIKREDILVEEFDPSTRDSKSIALKIQAFKPDLTILGGFYDHPFGLVRSIRTLFDMSKGNVLVSLDMVEVLQSLAPAEIEGIRAAVPKMITRQDRPRLAEWRKRFHTRFGREPHLHALPAYEMVMIIHDAAKRVSFPATGRQWLSALRATDIEGVDFRLRFDGDGNVPVPGEIGVFRNGRLIPDESVGE